jgi:nucleotide-binding universal stress UspA family protein
MLPVKKVLAPIAFDETENTSLDYAVTLAAQLGATVAIVHVYSIPVYGFPEGALITSPEVAAKLSEAAQKHLDAAVSSRKGRGVEISSVLREGNPWEEIVNIAKSEKADLIVMGTHRRRGVSRALLGSVAERVVRTSPIPVLVVHGP